MGNASWSSAAYMPTPVAGAVVVRGTAPTIVVVRVARTAWNHNTHHHATLLRQLPARVARGIDVGCGDGSFAAKLAWRCDAVDALDRDAEQVRVARKWCALLPNVKVIHADFLTADLPESAYDVVASLATFHHMPFDLAVDKARRLLRPGGRLLLLGVWTDNATSGDLAANLLSSGLNLILRAARGPDEMTAPQTMPTLSLPQLREAARRELPGARLTRRRLWRYTLVWDKPYADLTSPPTSASSGT